MSLKFGQIQLLVAMVTDRVMMEKKVSPLFLDCFYPFFLILAGNDDMHESSDKSNFGQIGPPTAELAALERLKNPHRLIIGKNDVSTFLGCSSSDPFHTCS